jgi:alpha-tubulin suppressor-like RCC1 family protein
MIKIFQVPVRRNGPKRNNNLIAMGDQHVLAVNLKNVAWSWGQNQYGELGDTTAANSRITPVKISGAAKTFCVIAGGGQVSAAIDKNGRVWTWGFNTSGQLGDNTRVSKRTPISILGAVKTFCRISAGDVHMLAIDKDGIGWSWGYGLTGRLGNASAADQCTPRRISGATKTFCEISAGYRHSLAIDKNGRVWAWGDGASGRLGVNSTLTRATPVAILGALKTFCEISAGANHSAAIDKNGRAWCWGSNLTGELGNNATAFSFCTPVSVAGAVKTFCQIQAGGNVTVALDKNGGIWTWGEGVAGKLGNGGTANRSTPGQIAGTKKTFCRIAAHGMFSSDTIVAVDKRGGTWTWGSNINGVLGSNDNFNLSKLTPVRVYNL